MLVIQLEDMRIYSKYNKEMHLEMEMHLLQFMEYGVILVLRIMDLENLKIINSV
jgi:hypothetical protein